MGSEAGLREDFNISASDERTVAEIARIIWEECGEDPDAFELEHLPSFEVDVVRRWPSVEKARRLLGWEAQIEHPRGDPRHDLLAARAGPGQDLTVTGAAIAIQSRARPHSRRRTSSGPTHSSESVGYTGSNTSGPRNPT